MKQHNNIITCIASTHGAPAVPATLEQWQQQRNTDHVRSICHRIDTSTNEEEIRRLKSQLPVWTPRCAEFRDNHRKQSEVLKPLQRLMLDIDEKGHTDDIVMMMKDGCIGPYRIRLIEESARHGTHVLVDMPQGMTPDDIQRDFSTRIGMPVDPAVKNPAGCIYQVPMNYTRYCDMDEAPAIATPAPEKTPRTKDKPSQPCPKNEKQTTTNEPPMPGLEAGLRAFDLCVEKAGLKLEEMDIWGEHNWHTNLMAVLSIGLPKLMPRGQLLGVIAQRLPNYAATDDCHALVDYFYDNYAADKGYMSQQLREINAEAQKSIVPPLTKAQQAENDRDLEAVTQAWNPPPAPKKLPRLIELLVGNYDPRFREMLILAALPVLSAHASHFRAKYINGAIVGPQQFVTIIGGSGSGKSNCTRLFNDMVKNTLEDNDTKEWEKVAQNSEMRDRLANSDDRPPKYRPRLRLFEGTSKSSILELQTNLGPNGMLLGQFSEADELQARANYANISVLLRKAWDMDRHRQYYLSDSTCNTNTRMSISLLMSGTVKAVLERMFNDSNLEGGLMQRFIPVLVPKGKRTFRPPMVNLLTDDEKRERDALLMTLYQKDLALGDDTQLLDTPLTRKTIENFYDRLEELYSDGLLTDAEADLSHRCGEFIIRAVIPLVALEEKESKETLDLVRWVGEIAFYNICSIFGIRVQKTLDNEKQLLENTSDKRKTVEPLLDQLPQVFTLKQIRQVRQQEGQSTDVKKLISRYCDNKKLERVGRGLYRKLTPPIQQTSPPT